MRPHALNRVNLLINLQINGSLSPQTQTEDRSLGIRCNEGKGTRWIPKRQPLHHVLCIPQKYPHLECDSWTMRHPWKAPLKFHYRPKHPEIQWRSQSLKTLCLNLSCSRIGFLAWTLMHGTSLHWPVLSTHPTLSWLQTRGCVSWEDLPVGSSVPLRMDRAVASPPA